MKLDRPVIFFDIESTGVDAQKDRIVTLSAWKFHTTVFGTYSRYSMLCNPGVPIPAEVAAIHGIDSLKVIDSPPFSYFAKHGLLSFFTGCDLAGYNLFNFDIPILWEEFNRNGFKWDLVGVRVLDVGNIFKKKEERTLSAAVLFYTGDEHKTAHTADGDVAATVEVFRSQLVYYDMESKGFAELAEFSKMDNRLDLAGIIATNDKGEAVFNTKRNRGVRVIDDPGYARWMLGADFSDQTKAVIQEILRA